jgi:hypothetical protein
MNVENPEILDFWRTQVNFENADIEYDNAPLSVPEGTILAKVHFLFIMLGLMQIYVTNKGQLSGVITRDSFIKFKDE